MSTPSRKSWVESANDGSGFGLQHLPFGSFESGKSARLCVAIGGYALDLYAIAEEFPAPLTATLRAPVLNPLLALGTMAWSNLRGRLQTLLADQEAEPRLRPALHKPSELTMIYPLATRGYVDFYASVDHARRVGEMFRPESPLLPNYQHLPIAYNGRASSLVVSGTPVRRPWGQRKPSEGNLPDVAPTAALDYELELAFVAGHGNVPGEPMTIVEARSTLFGVALLNDWSARDVQAWEYQPLGPFLGKSFATSMAAWITPMAALEPYRVPVRKRETKLLPYLMDERDQESGALDVRAEVWIRTEKHRRLMKLSESNVRELFWTPAQMLTHAASNGCPVETGDVFGSGTISGRERVSAGCLLELTRSGQEPVVLANGERRSWLEDGDEVILRAFAEREGLERIALGECVGRILPAHRNLIPR